MDGQGHLLTRVRAALQAHDDEALAALSNKGLVRRARKDLEKAAPAPIEGTESRLRFAVEDCTVSLGEVVKDADCTCPADGFCRHILAVILHLRESTPTGTPPPVSCGPEILAIDEAALERWAGKGLLRKAEEAVARGLAIEVDEGSPLVIRIPVHNVTCRWMPGAGIDGMICSCHAQRCEHLACAIVAYQVQEGMRQVRVEDAAADEPSGAPRTREEVLQSVGAVLGELVTVGLSRLSASVEQRLRTLAVSAHGVDLPRLERLLRTAADETRLFLARDAQASSSNLLSLAARVEALRTALATPRPAHVGEHRSRYDKVGDLELVGMGARRWRTRSGYTGLTVYFWDRSARNWATWSEARPVTVAGFNPAARFRSPGPWSGCESPERVSRGAVRLAGAFRNRGGRLSGRPGTRLVTVADADPMSVPGVVTRWKDVAERMYSLFAGGLGEAREQDEVVVLKPAAWGASRFDGVNQEATRPVRDDEGGEIPLVLPYTEENRAAVELLEKTPGESIEGLLGLLRISGGRLGVEPIALYQRNRTIHLTIDSTAPGLSSTSATGVEEEEEEQPVGTGAGSSTTPIGLKLTSLLGQLESLVEGGVGAYRSDEALKSLAKSAGMLGLTAVSASATRVLSKLDAARRGEMRLDLARSILRAAYVTESAANLESVSVAVASLS